MADKPDTNTDSKQEFVLTSRINDARMLDQLQKDSDMRQVGKQAIPLDTKLPSAFANNGNDLTIVGDKIDSHIQAAREKMTPEQLARAEKSADMPYRAIEAAGKGGPIPDVSAHRKSQEPIPVERQADVNRWITAASKIGEHNETRAKAGDSYWSIANNYLSDGANKASKTEVNAMMRSIAALNGKSEADSGSLAVNEIVKLPPKRKS